MGRILDTIVPRAETPWAPAGCRELLSAFIDDDEDDDDQLDQRDPITLGIVLQLAAIFLAAIAARSRRPGGLVVGGRSVSGDGLRVKKLVSRLLRADPILDVAGLARMVDALAGAGPWLPAAGILHAVEVELRGKPPRSQLRDALTRLREASAQETDKGSREVTARVETLLGGAAAAAKTTGAVDKVDAWTIALDAALGRMPAARRAAVQHLIAHATKATQAKPSKKWLAEAEPLVAAIGREPHAALLAELLAAVGTPAPFRIEMLIYGGLHHGDPKLVHDRYSDLLRGLVWSAIAGDTAALVLAIGDCAERCFKKLAGHGPLQPKIGNACLQVLSQVPSDAAVGQLTRLKMRAKHASVRSLLDKAVVGASERSGRSPEELEEVGAPTCGLDEIGRRVVKLAGGSGELRVGPRGVELVWHGKPPKTGPEVAAVKQAYKELAAVVPAQGVRLERLLLAGRSLAYPRWRERYADHVLVGALARRLIWWIGDRLASFDGDRLIDVAGKKLTPGKTAEVRLWHPLESTAAIVEAWRGWLEAHAVTQPFKQAHRELYRLTDAERATATYSNRFAAHLLRQHQLAALLHDRGWRYTLQGQWDSHNTPSCELPGGWCVELQVEPSGDETTGAGVHVVVGTDQVIFRRTGGGEPARLAEVPALVFSEAMRDVDLFVAVAGIGADPTWQDGGRHRDHHAYWHRVAFGELGEQARVRHDVLARLIPRLAIASRCKLTERFLEVRGELRRYRIHLGSAAIQMEPDSEYLCIVPDRTHDRGAADAVQLPFEGDGRLSEILSKAFMLAADDEIRDPSIRRQIEAR